MEHMVYGLTFLQRLARISHTDEWTYSSWAIWGSASWSRIVRHAAGGAVESNQRPWLDDPLSLQSNIINQLYEKAYKNTCEILLLLENQIG